MAELQLEAQTSFVLGSETELEKQEGSCDYLALYLILILSLSVFFCIVRMAPVGLRWSTLWLL